MYNAELYNQNNGPPRKDTLNFLNEYSSKIKWKNFARIVDIGCADGSVTEILKSFIPKNFTRLVGCDISEKMVRFANEQHGDDRTTFMTLDIASELSPELRGNFDHVFSFYMLHWVPLPDQEKAIRNIYELLTEGGDCLLTSLVGKVTIMDAFRVLSKRDRWSSFLNDIDMDLVQPYSHLRTSEPENEVRRLMDKVGFKNITVERKNISYTFNGLDVYKRFVEGVSPFEIPEELQEEFFKDFLQIVEDFKPIRKENEDHIDIIFDYKTIIVYGIK